MKPTDAELIFVSNSERKYWTNSRGGSEFKRSCDAIFKYARENAVNVRYVWYFPPIMQGTYPA